MPVATLRTITVTCALCALSSSAVSAAQTAARPQFGTWGVDLTSMDRSVKPGDNFFDYVNGHWLKSAQIPADRSSTGSFQDLQILSEQRLRSIIQELEARPYAALTIEERKLRDLYDAFEDTAQIEARALDPIKGDLTYLAGLKTHDDVARAMGSVRLSTAGIYDLDIGIDDKHPDRYSVNLRQSGLGLPDRDYYLKDDKALGATRDAYKKYLAGMLQLASIPDAEVRAAAVFELETQIARAQWNRADRRDADKTYNPMSVSALKALAPDFPWAPFFSESHVPVTSPKGERVVIVAEKSAFEPLAHVFVTTPVNVWRDYLTVHYLHTVAALLPKRFDDADFALYGTVLGGRSQQLARPIRCVHLLDATLGEALGQLYVARYFPPQAKAKADALVSNLLQAYEADIKTLTWMSSSTRDRALEKIHHFMSKIGYPSHWRDYSAYLVKRDDLIGDMQRGTLFEWDRELKRLDGPVDRSEWGMTPSTINAYYDP